jgi:FdhD protein
MNSEPFLTRPVKKVSGTQVEKRLDDLALEQPLEIRLMFGPESARAWKSISITMRTPGHDRELAVGFLVGEGIIRSLDQVEAVFGRGPRYEPEGFQHSVQVTLKADVKFDLDRLQRNFYTTSSCGVCGKSSIEALELSAFPKLPAASWQILPERLRHEQILFQRTGGLHGAGLFTPEGKGMVVHEDVGRHNAVDKVIGSQFLAGRATLSDALLVVSGRASFELMQKAIAAGIPMLVAVGAPSSLAVEVAEKFGATLVGFTKPTGFNIYTGSERVL